MCNFIQIGQFMSWGTCWEWGGGGNQIVCPLKLFHSVIQAHRTKNEGNVLFNDALNTFYLRVYCVRYMVKYQSDREIGKPLLPHGLSFRLAARVTPRTNALLTELHSALTYTNRQI